MTALQLPSVNDNGTIQLPLFTCGELASVISCVLAVKAQAQTLAGDPDFQPALNKLIKCFMEQAQ